MIREIKITVKDMLNITIEGSPDNQDKLHELVRDMGRCIMEDNVDSLSIHLDEGTEIIIPWKSIFIADMSINGQRYG